MAITAQVLGDVFEAIIATVFIDSEFDLVAAFGMLDKVYEDIMPFVENGEERKASFLLRRYENCRLTARAVHRTLSLV